MAETADIHIQKKLRLLKIGLFGFIGCLVLCFFSLVLQAVMALWRFILGTGDAGAWPGAPGLALFPVFFVGAFAFFGVIIASAVKEPRTADMGEQVKPLAGSFAAFFVAGILVNVLPLLVSMAVFFGAAWYRGAGVIFLALGYFVLSISVFFTAVGYAIIRGAGGAVGTGPGATVMKRIMGALRPGALTARSRRALSRVELALGTALGAVLFLLFNAGDLYERYRSFTGHGSDGDWLELLVSTGAALALFSIFIFVFSTLFIIKAVKTAFDREPGAGEHASADNT
jgi:hypothetical protein